MDGLIVLVWNKTMKSPLLKEILAYYGIEDLNIEDKNNSEKILDTLSNYLCEFGLDENSNPNAIGYGVEDLIDYFNKEIYE